MWEEDELRKVEFIPRTIGLPDCVCSRFGNYRTSGRMEREVLG